MDKLDAFITTLDEKRTKNKEERLFRLETQAAESDSRKREIADLRAERLKCTEAIVNNLNLITANKHTISKAVQQSDECTGLPISNAFHRKAQEFVSDAVNLINGLPDLYKNQDAEKGADPENLSGKVQCCAQSSADAFKEVKSSVDRVETLMNNVPTIIEALKEEKPALETSIFDE